MNIEQKRPDKVIQVGERTFNVYLEYDAQLGERYLCYPDFEKAPEYTSKGRPFATAEQEHCLHAKPNALGSDLPSDCGGCGWFYREHTAWDPIGVCMCEALRKKEEAEE